MIVGPYKTVELTRGLVTFVSEEDFERVNSFKWYANPCGLRGLGSKVKWYARSAHPGGKQFYLHRWLMDCPPGMVVDHIDGNSLNNTRANLRIVTAEENTRATRFKAPQPVCSVDPFL